MTRTILYVFGLWFPVGAVTAALGVAFAEALIGQGSFISIGLAMGCAGVLWKASAMNTSISNSLSQMAEKLDKVVTHDALELKIYEERERNSEIYVKQHDCDLGRDKPRSRAAGV